MGNLVTETDMYTGRMIWRHREKKTAMWPERCIYKPRNTKDWQWTAESINRRALLDIFTFGLQVFLRAWSFKLAAVWLVEVLHSCIYLSGQIWIRYLRAKLTQTPACRHGLSQELHHRTDFYSWRSSVRSSAHFRLSHGVNFVVAMCRA